jgi:hypothetical protein
MVETNDIKETKHKTVTVHSCSTIRRYVYHKTELLKKIKIM